MTASRRNLIARGRDWAAARLFNLRQRLRSSYKEYSAVLPDGFPARKITLRLRVPPLPIHPVFAFTDHAVDEHGHMTQTVIAKTDGGFAISHDLGRTWKHVVVKGYSRHRFAHVKAIGQSEFLAQAVAPGEFDSKTAQLDVLVVNERGDVLTRHRAQGHRWHGCRAVDMSGGTIMYAEYPSNIPVKKRRPSSARVFRSRDRGRSWQCVFEQTGEQIRHFHFLQARPGVPKEWWLTSGDLSHESRIWRSMDDGETWNDLTATIAVPMNIDGRAFERGVFRLTDLDWRDGQIVWGTDDLLVDANPPGARIFRSKIGPQLSPELVGAGRWPFRNVVDIGDFWLFISQSSKQPDAPPRDRKPGVYLLPKDRSSGGLAHLFDLDSYPTREKPGFTFSKASRAAVNGVFFSFRSGESVFPTGHQILEWHVQID